MGFSAVKALPSPFYGHENHSRDSVESLGFERFAKALRFDIGYLRASDALSQGRRQPAKRTLDAARHLPYGRFAKRSAFPVPRANWRTVPVSGRLGHYGDAHGYSAFASLRAWLAPPPAS